MRTTLLLLLLLLLAPAARAEELGVSGKDVAGKVTLADDTVSLAVTTFSKSAPVARTITGRVVSRTPSTLRFTWTKTTSTVGLSERLAFWRPPVPTVTNQTVTVDMRRESGAWVGTVDGQAQRWLVQPAQGDLVVLVVPGLSTNLWNQYGVPYLDENLGALRARGFEARRLTINTEESIAVNAREIAAEIRKETTRGKRVLLLAHSKGGADTVTALSDPANRDLLPRIAALMAIQPVYGGSPIADLVGSHCAIQGVVDLFFERVLPVVNRVDDTGDRGAVQDLRTERRQALLREHPFPVDRVATVVCRGHFSGRAFAKPRHVLRKPLWAFQKFLESTQHIQSDGMVALSGQHIPGAKAELTLDDIDHFEPGFRGESPFSPCDVTNRLLDATMPFIAR
jgi:hypothetical protein